MKILFYLSIFLIGIILIGNTQAACLNTLEESTINDLAAKSNVSATNLLYVFNQMCERVSINATDARYYTKEQFDAKLNDTVTAFDANIKTNVDTNFNDYKTWFEEQIKLTQTMDNLVRFSQLSLSKDEVLGEVNKKLDESETEIISHVNNLMNRTAKKEDLDNITISTNSYVTGMLFQKEQQFNDYIKWIFIILIAGIAGTFIYFKRSSGFNIRKDKLNLFKDIPKGSVETLESLASNNSSRMEILRDRENEAEEISKEKDRKKKEEELNKKRIQKIKDKLKDLDIE